jgi:hypothetical protein
LKAAWDAVASFASPALKTAMIAEKDRFHQLQDFAQKSFAQWADLLELDRPVAPYIHISNLQLVAKEAHFTVNQITGRSLSLWRSTDLVSWQRVAGFRTEFASYSLKLIDPARGPIKAFYQLRAE